MTWFQRLYESYENCVKASEMEGNEIIPIYHSLKKANIEVTINGEGEFVKADILDYPEPTIIPSTEKSDSRTNNKNAPAPHGLADRIQYCAKDYKDYGNKKGYYDSYYKQLYEWCNSKFYNIKVAMVLKYLEKGTLIKNLVKSEILWLDKKGKLLVVAEKENKEKQKIFKHFKHLKDQGAAFVRWRVWIKEDGDIGDKTWEDKEIRNAWIEFIRSIQNNKGLCYVTGELSFLSEKHPSEIRGGDDKAKLISSNDEKGFTFRGRFESASQALGISFEVSQKAHNALKWLLKPERKQAYRNGNQVFIAWSIYGSRIPKPLDNSYELFEDNSYTLCKDRISPDIGKVFAEKLSKMMKGYTQKLGDTNAIIILGIDSATKGRLSVIYYKELEGSVFIKHLKSWHSRYSWLQYYGKDKKFYGAPSPKDIAEIAYGKALDNNLEKLTVKRILPCIIENKSIPEDIVLNCIRRASNPVILGDLEKRKVLSIACALYKGNRYKEIYEMALKEENSDRNYLYGRLLGIVDYAERIVLEISDKQRPTNAQRYMHMFSMKPYSTWIKLYKMFNTGYVPKLLSMGEFSKIDDILQQIHTKFTLNDYKTDSELNGEFLLGYFCQLDKLRQENKKSDN